MAEEKAYTQAAGSGKYEKVTSLLGKYDNIRKFWEDQMTALFLRPALAKLVAQKRERSEKIRILDLGCGSGDGYDLMMSIQTMNPGLQDHETALIPEDLLAAYVGLDVNDHLLRQARDHIGHLPKVSFIKGDLSDGLPAEVLAETPFDIYLTTFGTLSHFTNDQCTQLMADIFRHAPDHAVVVGDWLGRFSYEWRDLWHHPTDREYFMDYRISYIYPREMRDQVDVAHFPLRLMNRGEIETIVEQAAAASKVTIDQRTFFDRSVLIGRHMDTEDYNPDTPGTRLKVNSLFEKDLRTDLEDLRVDFVSREGFGDLNAFYEKFFRCCNQLVAFTDRLMRDYDTESGKFRCQPEIPDDSPSPLKTAMQAMQRLVEGVAWIQGNDVRANVIEPHLGYALRTLEMVMQQGNGLGHSLVGVFEIQKKSDA